MNNRRINRKKYSRRQVTFNRIIVIAIVLMIILLVSFIFNMLQGDGRNDFSSSLSSQPSSSSEPEASSSSSQVSSSSKIAVTDIPMLVNKDNPIPEAYKLDLVDIDGKQMDRTAADAFSKMKAAYAAYAKEQGYSEENSKIWAQSPYRSHARQTELWTQRYNENKKDLGTDKAAYAETAKLTAYPGTSEHETGLAIDINNVSAAFEMTKQFQWLIKNCADYGFILRYPNDKVSITNIDYEPWHYRYVGTEHAKYIMENKLCLEEYVEILKKQNNQ